METTTPTLSRIKLNLQQYSLCLCKVLLVKCRMATSKEKLPVKIQVDFRQKAYQFIYVHVYPDDGSAYEIEDIPEELIYK